MRIIANKLLQTDIDYFREKNVLLNNFVKYKLFNNQYKIIRSLCIYNEQKYSSNRFVLLLLLLLLILFIANEKNDLTRGVKRREERGVVKKYPKRTELFRNRLIVTLQV